MMNKDILKPNVSMQNKDGIKFFSGVVVDLEDIPLKNTVLAIEYQEMWSCNGDFELIGYTKTDEKGYFSFYIDINKFYGKYYKISVYNQLLK